MKNIDFRKNPDKEIRAILGKIARETNTEKRIELYIRIDKRLDQLKEKKLGLRITVHEEI
jgi:hypothetical protein